MLVQHIILALVLILALSFVAKPVARFLHMPLASILVIFGFACSELVVYAGIDTGIRADNFQTVVFYVFIPVLVFESAYSIDKQQLKNNLIVILLLAVVAMLLTWTIQSIAFSVVIFSLFVQAPVMPVLAGKLLKDDAGAV